jgi:LuxR family transcriptional regulator, maltose regulon positive regulatory protein
MLHSIQVPALSAVTESLIGDLARSPATRVVVLDDCHLVTRMETQKLLAEFAGHLPPECHLVIATRMDPAFPLARLRARAQIVEVRADELRFLPKEAAAFLREVMELDLDEEYIALLEERTEGWAAGLQMAALSLRNRRDPAAFIRSFGGSHRHVVDYLAAEVMDGQPAERQEFLLNTSILERFCGGLCDELLCRRGSQVMLEELDRANLFLVPLDGERTWYRYHHLFAELLRHRLRQCRPSAEIEDLHGRAARWLDDNGDPEEAMRHFLAGRKHEEAIRLMDRCQEAILARGGLVTLLQWAQQLPAEEVARSPEACVTLGTVFVWAGRPEDAERHFARADVLLANEAENDSSSRVRSLRARAAIMRAYVADVTGASGRAIELAREGDALLPPDTYSNHRSLIAYILCRAYRYEGDLEQAKAYARVMMRLARTAGNVWGVATAVHELIWLCRHQGRLREADRELEAFGASAREAGSAGPIAKLTASRGELQRERGDLDGAARTILAAQEDVGRWGLPSDIYFCRLLRSRLALSQGDPAAAAEEVRRADDVARSALVFASMSPLLEAERARVFLALGKIEEALAWMVGYPVPDETNQMNHEVVLIAHARVLLAAGRGAEASELLDRLAAGARAAGRYGRLLEIMVLRAAAGTGPAADEALRRALEIAEPEGYVRIFLDEGEPVACRIRAILDRPDALAPRLADYARRLLSVARS